MRSGPSKNELRRPRRAPEAQNGLKCSMWGLPSPKLSSGGPGGPGVTLDLWPGSPPLAEAGRGSCGLVWPRLAFTMTRPANLVGERAAWM